MKLVLVLMVVVVALIFFLARAMVARESSGLKKYARPSPPPEDPHHGNAYGPSEKEMARRMAMVQRSIAESGVRVAPPALESAPSTPVEDKGGSSDEPRISIVVTPGDSLLSELGRKATAAKDADDLELAVDCLVRQRARAAELGQDLSVQTLLRLPLFLQRKGDFQSALAEFEVLLESAESLAGFPGASPSHKAMLAALWRRDVYDKMRVACKRQKESCLADECALAAERESEQAEVLREVVDEEHRLQHEDYLARQAERRKRRNTT